MEPVAKSIKTPIGRLPAPLHPGWRERLAECETDQDLFELVEEGGFINPDAINEVMARGLYGQYCRWDRARREQR